MDARFDPVLVSASIAGCVTLGGLGLSWLTREVSWVDRLWSVVPPVYVGTYVVASGGQDPRLVVMLLLTSLWGARLTFNFARKGGYAPGGEDYRWEVLRRRMSRWQWVAFNIGFVSIYQNLLLWLITVPAWVVWAHPAPLGVADLGVAAAFLLLLIGETVADQQQWAFHQAKRGRAARGEAEPFGFLDQGLWAWSRHPNFVCEQGQWWLVYAFGVVASGEVVDPSGLGALLLSLLFHGSARFTESITASKYPAYADYQRRVPRMVPWRW